MAKLNSFDEFYDTYLGKAIDYDGVAGVQCVDVADQYLKDLFDITGVWVNGARDLYNNFNSYPALVKNFNRIPNTRDLVVQKGDIVIWNGGSWGHVAIGTGEGNIDWFNSIEQNTLGKHEPTQLVKHYFAGTGGNDGCNPVLGVLRAKDQSKVLGKTKTSTPATTPASDTAKTVAPAQGKKIVDVSQYQANVNYAAAAKAIDGMIIRVGYRGWGTAGNLCKDSQFENHIKGAVANKIPYGFYFFSQATNENEAVAEANYVYDLIKSYSPTYPIYIDVEESGAPNSGGRADKNSKDTWTKVCKAFCNRIKKLGYNAGIYASLNWFTNKLNFNELTSYSIWCASYGSNDGQAHIKPNLNPLDGWQFTSQYSLSGFSGKVDMSYFYKEFKTTQSSSSSSGSNTAAPAQDTKPSTSKVEYETYYVNITDGLNYRSTPNGELKGTLKNGTKVEVIKGSDKTANGLIWIQLKDKNWVAKKYLSKTKPATVEYSTYYVNCADGLNYRETPNGTLKGTLKNGTKVEVVKGSGKTVNGLVWVKLKNGSWVAKKYLSTTKPTTSGFIPGKYAVQADMKIRTGAGTSYAQKKRSSLPADIKKLCYNQTSAVLKKGSVINITKVVKTSNGQYWGQFSGGYICLKAGSYTYAKIK